MTTPIADMVASMLAAGVPHEAIILAVQTAEMSLLSRDISGQSFAEKQREYERERKRRWRQNVPGLSRDKNIKRMKSLKKVNGNVPGHVNGALTSSSSSLDLFKKEEDQKERKGEEHGTRLSRDWKPTPKQLAAATKAGLNNAEIATEETKFRNHWISTTKNATKRDWDATWQNWVIRAAGDRKPWQMKPASDPNDPGSYWDKSI